MSQSASSDISPIQPHTFEATLHGPLFYGSKEGSVIETDPTVSATALMHAIGYEYFDLEKAFLLTGKNATTPQYERLGNLPFFVSEMVPKSVDATERTFRTTSYATERTIVTQDHDVGKYLTGSKRPVPRRFEGSNAGWHKMREFVGLSPGSTFRFTVWGHESTPIPEQLGFRLGIKRTGEVRAQRLTDTDELVALNQYLLSEVYGLETELITNLMEHSQEFTRGNDVRTSRFLGVERSFVDDVIAPEVLSKSHLDSA